MVGLIITLIVVGLIAGALARLLVPGKDPMGIGATILLGIVGSFVGGFLGYVLFHKDKTSGFIQLSGLFGSVIGAIIVLLAYRAFARRKKVARS
ncbi:MAG: GlsB/YeaQ/YmgE family stress response membrane protein [Pseudonocardiales bacterium]|nr:MAG: GlsB/YeaQ/YmgE family stress response membrane protein [Pseudonocardiales bacterium]